MMQQLRSDPETGDGYEALLTAVLRAACEDVHTYCELHGQARQEGKYAARRRLQFSLKGAIHSLAWLTGITPGALPAAEVCQALGAEPVALLDRLEREIGHERFVELSDMARNFCG